MPRTKKKITAQNKKPEPGRNANGMGSLRQITRKGKEYWEGRYSVKDQLTGKNIQRSVYGKTKAEASKNLSKVLLTIDEGTYVAPSKQTLGEWLDIWLDTYITPSVKPYTLDSYTSACKNHIKPSLGAVKLSTLSALQIQQFYNRVLLRDKKLSPKTIKNIHGILHRALAQAVRIGNLHHNPADACDLPKIYKKDITPLEQDDVEKFLKAIQGTPFECIYQVTLFTGMRQGEVLGLTWDCVDFEKNTLYINKQLQKSQKVGGTYQLVPTKNGKSRLITVAASVTKLLRKQKSQQAQDQLLAGPAWNNPDNLIFTNQTGGHLTHVTIYKHFKKTVRNLGLDHIRFHDLRHSYAVAMIENGEDIKTLQENLGHATASFTMDIYAHASRKMRQQSADRMEQYIQRVSGQKSELG